MNMRAVLWVVIGLAAVSSAAFAQTDEIQVYDAEIEPQGIFNLMVHSNFAPDGLSPFSLGLSSPITRSTELPNGPTA